MNLDTANKLLERRTGLNYAQNKSLFGMALSGAMDEIGANLEVPRAQTTTIRTIAASENKVRLPESYTGRVISVEYKYDSGGVDYKNHLTNLPTTAFEEMNSGQQDLTTDNIRRYNVSGRYLRIGPRLTLTGGSVIIIWQRPLMMGDIELIPDGMMVVDGAESNIWKSGTDEKTLARASFLGKLKRVDVAIQPVMEKHSERGMPDQVLLDQAYMEEL